MWCYSTVVCRFIFDTGDLHFRILQIHCELILCIICRFVFRKVKSTDCKGVICIMVEDYICRMGISVVGPSALVIFSIMYVALIEAEAYDRRFVVDFQCCSLRSRTVGGPVFRVYTYLYIVGVELVRVDIYMSGPYLLMGFFG